MSEQFDLGALVEQAQQMQRQLVEAQAAASEQVVEGQAGGGAVKVAMTGGMEFRSVSIDAAAVDPDDVGMLEDLVLAACNDAMAKANEVRSEVLGSVDLGGGSLPGLAGA